jgi:hypothetical protein
VLKTLYSLLLVLYFLLLSASCGKTGEKIAVQYSYSMSRLTRQDAPYEIRLGLYEGCVTGIWARSNPFYRYLVSYRQNPSLVYNEVYKYAWNRAYNVCFQMNNADGFTVVGGKAWNNRLSGIFDIRDAQNWKALTVGGSPDQAPNWVFDENSNNAIPGTADANKVGNFFGFWGTCQFC